MNDSKCPHCGEQMVWEGDMLSGGLACKTDHYADAGYDTEGVITEQQDAMQKVVEDYIKGSSPYDKSYYKQTYVCTTPEEDCAPKKCTDYVNDRCNFSEGGR